MRTRVVVHDHKEENERKLPQLRPVGGERLAKMKMTVSYFPPHNHRIPVVIRCDEDIEWEEEANTLHGVQRVKIRMEKNILKNI